MIFNARQRRLFELLQGAPWDDSDSLILYGHCKLDAEIELPAGLLAHLGILQNWEHTPEMLQPRLQGIRKRRQVSYTMQLPDARRLFDIWHETKRQWLLIEDAALQLISGTDYPFPIAYFTVYMEKKDIPDAIRQAQKAGFALKAATEFKQLQTKLCCVKIIDKLPKMSETQSAQIAALSVDYDFHGAMVPVISAEHLLLLRMQETLQCFGQNLSAGYLLEKSWETGLLFPFVDWKTVNSAAIKMYDSPTVLCMADVLYELFQISELKALEDAIINYSGENRKVIEKAQKLRKLLEKGMRIGKREAKSQIIPARLRKKLLKRKILYLIGT